MNIAAMAEHLADLAHPVFQLLVIILNIASVLILVVGIVKGGVRYIRERKDASDSDIKSKTKLIARVKTELGMYILFSLEILIVADIIESTMEPSFDFLIRLALIVVIRTTLSFFLGKEIQHEQHELKELEAELELCRLQKETEIK